MSLGPAAGAAVGVAIDQQGWGLGLQKRSQMHRRCGFANTTFKTAYGPDHISCPVYQPAEMLAC
jgi:hypothetical protein